MKNKIDGLRIRRSKLVRYIHLCENYKTKIALKLISLKKSHVGNIITSKEIAAFSKKSKQWTKYYDSLISKYETKIKDITKEIKEINKQKESARTTLVTISSIVLILAMVGLFTYFVGPQKITGMATSDTIANVSVENAAPTVTDVTITPASPTTTSNLSCSGTTDDANQDSVSLYYKWYINTTLDPDLNGMANISYTNTSKGDNWTCELTPFDGTINGTPLNTSVLIQNIGVNVTLLEITDNATAYTRMSLTPVQNSTSFAAIRATVYDLDGPSNQTVTAYICDTTDYASCDNTTFTYTQNLTYLEAAPGSDEYYYTYNGSQNMPTFWKLNGTWKLYVQVRDGEFVDQNETDFEYLELMAVDYPSNVTLGGGTAALNQWNNGTDDSVMVNWGNVILSIQWNITDPTSGGDTWTLNSSDFAIDDDPDYTSDSGNLTTVYLNETPSTFEHASGLLRCTTDSCINENSSLDSYYHIYPPLGLEAGTYNTTILITLSKKT